MRAIVPVSIRRRLSPATALAELSLRIDALERRLEALETQLHESREDAWKRSRERWRAATPDARLTWGAEVSGEAFIEKAEEHGVFGAARTVLEVGPGYGRLLDAALERGVPFASWIGVDLSADNVAHLRGRFQREDVRFVHGDAETTRLDTEADALISSLTFKHLFPSFEPALRNLVSQLRSGALIAFDLIEGRRRYFEEDGVTYIRWYSRGEAEEILEGCGLEPVAFDEVRHLPELARMLVVARKPGQ